MNYYAGGGQPQGLKSLAQELQSYGRNGDTLLAHINPQEAAMLKAAGGSGTINPATGLPEYGWNPIKTVTNIVSAPFKAVNEVVKAVPFIGPAIDKGLVSLDKAVGNVIPGGWNTLAQTALAFTPLGLPAKVGLAALGGSGAFGPKGKFNFQRALLSGAMAYGANQLVSGFESAGGAGADATATDIASKLGVEGASAAPGSQAAMLADQAAGFGDAGLRNVASSAGYNALPSAGANTFAYNAAGEMVPANVMPQVTGATTSLAPTPAPGFLDRIGATDFIAQTGDNLAAAGRGIQNLTGFGTGAQAAASEFVKPITTGGMTALAMGTLGTMSLDEQQKYLDQQSASGNISQQQYDAESARIAEARARAEQAVRENPYQFASGGKVPGYFAGGIAGVIEQLRGENSPISSLLNKLTGAPVQAVSYGGMGLKPADPNRIELSNAGIRANILDAATDQQIKDYINAMRKGDTEKSAYRAMINNPYQFANGGSIDDSYGYDTAMGSNVGNMDSGVFAPNRYAQGGLTAFSVGGEPRMLAGGGDGVSDSIPATINGNRPAKLSDGEFVVPARIVSELGNGSSQAGAKALYGMMDRVQKARAKTVGKKGVAKDSNAKKYLPA